MIFHQSDLSAWNRCPAAFGYRRQGWPEQQSSAAAYGSVMHHALLVFERARAEGQPHQSAVKAAVSTFVWFWNPMNIAAVTDPVEIWFPRQGYSDMREKGIRSITQFCELVKFDDAELLGTEMSFMVPIDGTWDFDLEAPHILAGSIDRLVTRRYRGHLIVGVDDFKTGMEYRYLRQNLQFSAYCYATTRPEMWVGWNGEDGFGTERGTELYERFQGKSRRGTWINLRSIKFQDAGWRGPIDYQRFALAVQQIYLSMREDIYPLTLAGDVCTFCPFREGCGGVGVPDDDHGSPLIKRRSAAPTR